MGYLLKAIIGAALFIGGTVLFQVQLVELLETGTCASGNQPFEVARECPEGIGTAALLLVGGVFGAMLGAALFLLRGTPPWSGGRRSGITGTFGWSTFGWGLFFGGTGAATLIASKTSETMPQDGELGGTIVGVTFLVMGIPALVFALWSLVTSLGGRDERPTASAVPAASGGGFGGLTPSSISSGGSGAVGKLERLQRLREKGALTEPEFEREKAKILAEM